MTIRVSVVVASFRDVSVLDASLASLVPQCSASDVELIVARRDSRAAVATLASRYPTVRWVAVALGADLPRIRGAGLAAAGGEIVALTEDHCVADAQLVSTWRGVLDAQPDADVLGGRMDNAQRARSVDWAAFFSEYGFFAAERASAKSLITGANVAYSRRVVPRVAQWMTDGAWENVVHDRLRESGARFAFEPRACVSQNLSYSVGAFAHDRYEHGRDYAQVRLAERRDDNRWIRLATTPVLPALLMMRTAAIAVGSTARALAFARALPFTLMFFGAWSAGEAVGYLRGPAATRGGAPREGVGTQ